MDVIELHCEGKHVEYNSNPESVQLIPFAGTNSFLHATFFRNDGDLELLDPELHSPELLKCVWEDAITDVAVVRYKSSQKDDESIVLEFCRKSRSCG